MTDCGLEKALHFGSRRKVKIQSFTSHKRQRSTVWLTGRAETAVVFAIRNAINAFAFCTASMIFVWTTFWVATRTASAARPHSGSGLSGPLNNDALALQARGWVLQWSGPAGPRRYGPCGVGPREPAWARRAREPARARGARRGVAVLCSTV